MQVYRHRRRIEDLVNRGLTLGSNVIIEYTAEIDNVYPYLIRIGDNSSISNHARLLAHDATPFKFVHGYTRLGQVDIKENCFVGEYAIILPGVTIGPNALVAAGSVVNRTIPPNSCVAGVPARVYAKFDDLMARHKQQIESQAVFDYSDVAGNVDERHRAMVWSALQDGGAYVRGYTGEYPYTVKGEH
jgi:maltose O-acetyltransferase